MTVRQLVGRYERGACTEHELVTECLNLLDPGDPAASLGLLPPQTLAWLREFVDGYRPGEMHSLHGGAIPTPEQVSAARRWLGRP